MPEQVAEKLRARIRFREKGLKTQQQNINQAKFATVHKRNFRWRDIIIGALALIIIIGIVVLATLNIFNESFMGRFHNLQYLGLFIISFLTGAVAFIPIPGLILVFALGSVLFPPFIGLISGMGEAVGSMLVYFTGYGGNAVMRRLPNHYTGKFESWLQKRGSLTVVLMSAITNPLFMPFAAVAGMMRYNVWKFFLMCFIGKTVKNMLIAYLGYLGLGSLLRLIGVPI